MLLYTDGAAKRPGKTDCISGYGFALEGEKLDGYMIGQGIEHSSTSQRGEILGALHGLTEAKKLFDEHADEDEVLYFVTDSHYVGKCLRDCWYLGWIQRDWMTKDNAPVKNQDLWKELVEAYEQFEDTQISVLLVPGHVKLYNYQKKGEDLTINQAAVDKALDTFIDNNDGLRPPDEFFIKLLKGNAKADELAVGIVDVENKKYVATIKDVVSEGNWK